MTLMGLLEKIKNWHVIATINANNQMVIGFKNVDYKLDFDGPNKLIESM